MKDRNPSIIKREHVCFKNQIQLFTGALNKNKKKSKKNPCLLDVPIG